VVAVEVNLDYAVVGCDGRDSSVQSHESIVACTAAYILSRPGATPYLRSG
jgi:hypothetical protein